MTATAAQQDDAGFAGSAWRTRIDDNNRAYQQLQRHGGVARDIVFAKVQASHQRTRLATQVLQQAQAQRSAGSSLDGAQLVDDLLALQIRLDDDQLAQLDTLVGDAVLAAQVYAAQGQRIAAAPELQDLAGPDLDLDIKVNRDSHWPFARWSQQPEFANYRFEGHGVRYRGLLLHAGDLILPNVNLDGNFVYSALSDPKGFCPHSAVFVILEAHGRRYPAVVETYEKGLRAVPLCVFLNDRYISYAEIYRHRQLDPADATRVSTTAHAALEVARGYNFNTLDDDRAYVCCTTVARQLYQDLGLPVLNEFGAIRDPGVQATMRQLDYHFLDIFFTPIDFVLSDLFEFVGWVDNAQPARLVARELVEQRFRYIFSEGSINPRTLPLMVRLNLFGIRQMRARTLVGRLVSKVMGFDHISLPKGPDRILAIVEPLEAELGNAVRGMLPAVQEMLASTDLLDMEAVLADAELCAQVKQLLPMRWMAPAGD